MAKAIRNPGVGTGHGERIKKRHECEECGAAAWAVRSDVRFCPRCMSRRRSRNYEARHRTDACPDCASVKSTKSRYCRACSPRHSSEQRRRRGADNHMWKGGRTRHSQGYIQVRVNGHYRLEHRVVYEQDNGPIPKNWLVHHLNGIKDDNRIENLVAMSRSQHHKNHHEPWEARIRDLEAQLGG